jgi:hypothetical protein
VVASDGGILLDHAPNSNGYTQYRVAHPGRVSWINGLTDPGSSLPATCKATLDMCRRP